MKLAITILASILPALAVESLKGEIVVINAGNVAGASVQVEGYAFDINNLATTFQVKMCWDDATFVSANCRTITANGTTPNSAYSPHNFSDTTMVGASAVGSVSPRDGSTHQLYAKMISQTNPGAGDFTLYVPIQGATSYPFRFSSVVQPVWTPSLLSLPASRLGASDLVVFANILDTYSVGSAGSTVCPGGTTATGSTVIKSDGIVGQYLIKRPQVLCNQVYEISTTVTKLMTDSAYNSDIKPTVTALPSTAQVIAIAWVQPSIVYPLALGAQYGNGIGYVMAQNRVESPNAICVSGSCCMATAASGTPNSYFNSNSRAPFTDFAIRPTMMLAFESCSTCGAATDWVASVANGTTYLARSVAATNVNPSGNGVYLIYVNDYGRNVRARAWSTANNGNAISSRISASIVGTASSPVTNLNSFGGVAYNVAGVANPAGAVTYMAGGVADSMTSSGGQMPFSGSQTPIPYWSNQGAYGSYGTVSEPCLILAKFPWPDIFEAYYTQGATLVEAYWKSVQMPFQGNFVGDPLLAPYALAGTTVIGNKALSSARGLRSRKAIR